MSSAETTLITGGVRSGKSAFAQRLAANAGLPVCFIATAQALDDEFRHRIERHRQDRPASWMTIEEPLNLQWAIARATSLAQVVLVDDLTLWVSNRLLAQEQRAAAAGWPRVIDDLERQLEDEVQAIFSGARKEHRLIFVSQETGWGIVPPYPLGRAYRDLLGRINQYVAQRATHVYLLVAGLPLDLRLLASEPPATNGR